MSAGEVSGRWLEKLGPTASVLVVSHQLFDGEV